MPRQSHGDSGIKAVSPQKKRRETAHLWLVKVKMQYFELSASLIALFSTVFLVIINSAGRFEILVFWWTQKNLFALKT